MNKLSAKKVEWAHREIRGIVSWLFLQSAGRSIRCDLGGLTVLQFDRCPDTSSIVVVAEEN